MNHLVKETSSEELTEEIATSSLSKLEMMNEMIFPIYDDLISFATTFKEENLEMFKTKRPAKGKKVFFKNVLMSSARIKILEKSNRQR